MFSTYGRRRTSFVNLCSLPASAILLTTFEETNGNRSAVEPTTSAGAGIHSSNRGFIQQSIQMAIHAIMPLLGKVWQTRSTSLGYQAINVLLVYPEFPKTFWSYEKYSNW